MAPVISYVFYVICNNFILFFNDDMYLPYFCFFYVYFPSITVNKVL